MINKMILILGSFLFTIQSTAVDANIKNDLLRIVCEEIDFRGNKLGNIIIMDQTSSELTTGSKILKDGRGGKSIPVSFSLKVFKNKLDHSGSVTVNDQVNQIIRKESPTNNNSEGIIGEGDVLGSSFAFRYNGADRVRFVLAFSNLDGGSYYFNSKVESTRYNCLQPYTIAVPTPPQIQEEIIETGYEESSLN